MPKKNVKITSLLIPSQHFQKAENADNTRELEECLTELINTANKHHNEAYQVNQPAIIFPEKFADCICNYKKIKDIINNKNILNRPLIKIYNLEASLTIIQAQHNKIDTNPKTKNQPDLIEEEINNIKIEFDKITIYINALSAKPKNNFPKNSLQNLQRYQEGFSKRWNEDSNKRKAHSYYNLAENLIERSNCLAIEDLEKYQLLTDAKSLLNKSVEFYEKAQLFNLAKQTIPRIKEVNSVLKTLLNRSEKKNTTSTPEKISLVLKRLPLSNAINNTRLKTNSSTSTIPHAIKPAWQVVTDKKTLSLYSTKNLGNTNLARNQIPSNTAKRKRLPFDEHASFNKAKKSKPFYPLESLWQAENEKIVTQFSQIKIDDNITEIIIGLQQKLPLRKSLGEYAATVQNNRAVTIITRDLQTLELTHPEKFALLKKAKNLLKKSAKFYDKASLSVKKSEVNLGIHCIESSLKNLASFSSKASTESIPSINKTEHLATLISTVGNISSKNRVAYYTRHANNFLFGRPLAKEDRKDEPRQNGLKKYPFKGL